jgi:CheY-like chemotaxis protein
MEPAKNVLIAEDDDDDFFIFSEAIKEISITVILSRAENGEILIRLLEEKFPDMVFLDISMPCVDGRNCLQHIRSNRRYDDLPVIMYTSISDFETVEFCYRQGSNFYVYKPNSYAELVEVLEKIFAIDWKKLMYYPPFSQYIINPRANP